MSLAGGAAPDARQAEHNPLPPSSELIAPVRRRRPGSPGRQPETAMVGGEGAQGAISWDQCTRRLEELSRKLGDLAAGLPASEPTPAQAKALRAAATAMSGHLGGLKRTGLQPHSAVPAHRRSQAPLPVAPWSSVPHNAEESVP